jgi:hypothetical protein
MSVPVESVEQLAQQIAELARSIDKLTHTWLMRIREFDACDGWANTGCFSMVAWLAWWTGISHKAASEHVRVARALDRLPLIDAAFASGALSYSKVRALTRIAEPEQQQSLLDVAKSATASQLDKIVAGLRRVQSHAGQANPSAREQPPRRYIHFTPTEDGMIRIHGQLGPEEALILQAAIHAADTPNESTLQSPAGDPHDQANDAANALVSVARGYLERKPTTRGSGFELLMVTTPEQLAHGPEGVGGFLRDGTPVPLSVAQMLACDAHRVDVRVGEAGQLDVGRSRRTIPTAIARALALRDGMCTVPGCGRGRHLHAHHVQAWAAGGETGVDNLVLLCPGHHWAVHEGRLRITSEAGKLEFRNAHGLTLHAAPHHAIDPATLEAIVASAGPAGDEPIFGGMHGDGRPMRLAEVIDWMMLAPGFRGTYQPSLAASTRGAPSHRAAPVAFG